MSHGCRDFQSRLRSKRVRNTPITFLRRWFASIPIRWTVDWRKLSSSIYLRATPDRRCSNINISGTNNVNSQWPCSRHLGQGVRAFSRRTATVERDKTHGPQHRLINYTTLRTRRKQLRDSKTSLHACKHALITHNCISHRTPLQIDPFVVRCSVGGALAKASASLWATNQSSWRHATLNVVDSAGLRAWPILSSAPALPLHRHHAFSQYPLLPLPPPSVSVQASPTVGIARTRSRRDTTALRFLELLLRSVFLDSV